MEILSSRQELSRELDEILYESQYKKLEHKLMRLPYAYDALEPFIDEETMRIHHQKHHQGYIDGLNTILSNTVKWASLPLDQLLQSTNEINMKIRDDICFYGGGAYNHQLFWKSMSPHHISLKEPLRSALKDKFGTIRKFKSLFLDSAVSIKGSGWCWLVMKNEKLDILITKDQDNPLMINKIPLLGIDMWEHAYYLKYQNDKKQYINMWWKIINWDEVNKRFNLK